MKKTLLLITLFITGVCFGQKYELAEEFYDNGLPKVINTYKVSKDKIELVKESMWYENGQKSYEGTYKDGQLDGKWTEWHENGQKQRELTYKDGIKDGKWASWYENGQKSYERTYKDGIKDGKWTYWSPDGKESSELIIKDGEAWNGVAMGVGYNDWIKHGVMERVQSYKNGKRDGKWIEHDFSSTGKVKKLRTYKDGVLIERIHWDEDGNESKDDGDRVQKVEKSVGEIRE